MIDDLDHLTHGQALEADICIIGSGAAGLAIARELLNSSLKVIILDGGGADLEPASQELYQSEITGLRFEGHMTGRFRVEGGSTTRWAGVTLPLSPIDFEQRDWVAHSGWPIRYEDLQGYFARATDFLDVDRLNYDTDLLRLLRAQAPELDRSQVLFHFAKFSPHTDFRVPHRAAIRAAPRMTLLRHANLTHIALSPARDRVVEVTARSLAGKSARVSARHFVLCAGGIENARLLLHNKIGNDHDLVGRYFQDHPIITAGTIRPRQPDDAQQLLQIFYRGGRKYDVRLSAAPELQRRQRILNVSSYVEFDASPDSPEQIARQAYRLLRARQIGVELAHKLLMCAKSAPSLIRPVWAYVAHGRGYHVNPAFRVRVLCEQEPSADSRITLSDFKTDSLGIPRSQVHWQLTERCHRSMRIFTQTLDAEFRRCGIGEIALHQWMRDENSDWPAQVQDYFHHAGTTRMHESPLLGVVDPACRVHGIDNFYIGGSSVFPTSGYANPTLTIIALAIRIADGLKNF